MDGITIAVISGVAAIFGGGWWGYVASRGERKLKAREVENATLTSVQSTYGGLIADMRDELARHDEQLNSQGEQIRQLRHEVRTQASVIHRLRAWMDDVHERWDVHRLRETPPAKVRLDD